MLLVILKKVIAFSSFVQLNVWSCYWGCMIKWKPYDINYTVT